MANYTVLDNATAQQITTQQCEGDANYEALKASFVAQGKEFYADRAIALVGVNSANPSESYTMVINPSFVNFDFQKDAGHEAASIVSFFAGGVGSHVAALAYISHNPLQIARITLKEIGKDGTIVDTVLDRVTLVNQTPDEIGPTLSVDHLNSPNATPASTDVDYADMPTIAAYALDTLLNDNYAYGLYPTGGVSTLSADAFVAGNFAQAIAMRAMEPILGLDITICCSCSSNACTSSSSSLKL